MRKVLVLTLAMLLISAPAFAGNSALCDGMGKRAIRGFRNMITGIVEFPVQIIKGYQHGFEPIENELGSKTVGTVLGFFRGISHTAGRTSSGALELMGFWAASPADNDGVGVPLDAEYAWEEGTQYSIFKPNFEEGVKPIGRKLGRGLGNGLLGILEVPGQIKKGADEGNVAKGTVKGIWYWFSREIYGFNNIFTALVPNPVDNKGVHFDEKWPWDALQDE